MSCVCPAFTSVHCCLVVTCLERADLLFVMFNCVSVTFTCGILGQVWYLIVSIPDLCHLSYFEIQLFNVDYSKMSAPRSLDKSKNKYCCIYRMKK